MSATATPDSPVCDAPARERAPCFGRYVAHETQDVRELVGLARPDGSTFVVDRLARTARDGRVVARIAASEPPENAAMIAEMYLADEPRRGRCRLLSAEDLARTRPASSPTSIKSTVLEHAPLLDGEDYCFRIRELTTGRSVPELRWARSRLHDEQEPPEPVTLRDVVARLEDYEPARALTIETLAAYREDPSCSTCTLDGELQRLQASTIVLNRGLREAVRRAVKFRGLSMSEIALRCGRTKRDRAGRVSGETSWLARRIGQLPESGEQHPSPWVQNDVLALIARDGLRVCPCEL
jgi:AraC-like DNA-binding protein